MPNNYLPLTSKLLKPLTPGQQWIEDEKLIPQATAYQKAHPGISYSEALKAVIELSRGKFQKPFPYLPITKPWPTKPFPVRPPSPVPVLPITRPTQPLLSMTRIPPVSTQTLSHTFGSSSIDVSEIQKQMGNWIVGQKDIIPSQFQKLFREMEKKKGGILSGQDQGKIKRHTLGMERSIYEDLLDSFIPINVR